MNDAIKKKKIGFLIITAMLDLEGKFSLCNWSRNITIIHDAKLWLLCLLQKKKIKNIFFSINLKRVFNKAATWYNSFYLVLF